MANREFGRRNRAATTPNKMGQEDDKNDCLK